MHREHAFAACVAVVSALVAPFPPGDVRGVVPCRIDVVERGTDWPVPLVELRTLHGVRLVTDNAGVIAFDLPELMGRETWFRIDGHGYGVRPDGFGYRGVRLRPEPGGALRVEVDRSIVARRLGRITGAGLFAESRKLGLKEEERETGVLGCDSVQIAAYRGRLHWLWGDTVLARYPLGIFHATGATSALRPFDAFRPPVRLRLDYYADDTGMPRALAPMPGEGPTWVSGLVVLRDRTGTERLVGAYTKVKPPMEAYETGLCAWNDARSAFEPVRVVWTKGKSAPVSPPLPEGHAVLWRDEAGASCVLFGNPLPRLRCPATFDAWADPGCWEEIVAQQTLVSATDGAPVKPHSGSIAFSPWRGRWVTVFLQALGKPSAFGELWYAEAPAPTGSWGRAVKVLSHDNYTFYNPRLHPEFTPPDSPVLLFEGTYTAEFADRPPATPRYNYNQVLYRLDLDAPALAPARGE